ncbi:hypothetical protein OROMI_015449 [Orobanche minor]
MVELSESADLTGDDDHPCAAYATEAGVPKTRSSLLADEQLLCDFVPFRFKCALISIGL